MFTDWMSGIFEIDFGRPRTRMGALVVPSEAGLDGRVRPADSLGMFPVLQPVDDDPDATQEVEHAGNFFKLPFGVEKKTYAWWDGDLGRATDLKFMRRGTMTVRMLAVRPDAIVATGRSDYPNQVNNVLCLDRKSTRLNSSHT